MRKIRLHWWIFLGILVGVAVGAALHHFYYEDIARQARIDVLSTPDPSPEQLAASMRQIQARQDLLLRQTFIGGAVDGVARLFLNLLMMIVIPLVFTSLVSGVTGLGDPKRLGRLGTRALLWYLCTSLLAILTGLVLVNLIRPGDGVSIPLPLAGDIVATPESVWDVVLNMIPSNVFRAAADFNLFPIIFFSILFGIFTLTVAPAARRTLTDFFSAAFEVMMKMTLAIMMLSPIGIAALIARLVAVSGLEVFLSLIGYVVTVALGLAIHFFITLPLILWLLTRRSGYRVMGAMSPALLTAFSTASSSGTLPLTMERAEKGVGVSNKVSSFVLPLGATINMDGTALYECVATIFVAQLYAAADPTFHLTIGSQIMIVVLSLMISIGAAGIPSAGLVMMVIIFQTVGLPIELTGLLWSVDRVLDMARTSVNIWSDVVGATTIAHFEGEIDESALFARAGASEVRAPQPVDQHS